MAELYENGLLTGDGSKMDEILDKAKAMHKSFLLENSRMDDMADYILKSILDLKDLSPQLAYQITKTIQFSKEFFKNKP